MGGPETEVDFGLPFPRVFRFRPSPSFSFSTLASGEAARTVPAIIPVLSLPILLAAESNISERASARIGLNLSGGSLATGVLEGGGVRVFFLRVGSAT